MDAATPDGIAFVGRASPAAALAALPAPLASWFRQRFGEPTAAQCLAWPAIASGHNFLVSAPTGTGKSLAAFLPILAGMSAPGPVRRGVRCLYVAPLKALGNDAHRNLVTAADEIEAFAPGTLPPLRLAVRTGDSSALERRRQRECPPDVLFTTPESLAVLLCGPEAAAFFAGLQWVVVDEVHALAPTKRGVDLALSLERLEALAGTPVQRIGLSATAAPLETAAGYLAGAGRPCLIGADSSTGQLELSFRPVDGGGRFLHELVTLLEPELRANRATLVFTNARGLAERLAWALRHFLPDWDALVAAHHSALSAERRREIEAAFKRGDLRVVVSSTSLELGIDVGSVDLVVLVHPPGDVVRLLQRVGRAGHGPGRIKRGLVLTASAAELLEAAVTGASGRSVECEALRIPDRPLDILCQHLAGMACAGPCDAETLFASVRRAAPYQRLDRREFDDCLAYLFGRDRFGQQWLPARLEGTQDAFGVRDARTARLVRSNLGSILAEETTPVLLTPDANRSAESADGVPPSSAAVTIGEVDHRFAEGLQPGDRFLLDGRCLEVRRLEAGSLLVEEVAGRPAVPRWTGDGWPLSAELAQRLYLLRVRAAEALRDSPAKLADLLQREYGLGAEAAGVLAEYFECQEALSEIPDNDGLLVEAIGGGAAAELYVHTPLNRLANDALARVAVHRLARDHQRTADSTVADLGFSLFIHGSLSRTVPELLRSLLDQENFAADLEAALAHSPALRERFRRVATTGLMLLRNPSGGQRKVGGPAWGERQLFDRVRSWDAEFVLLRQARRELLAELCDLETALQFAAALPQRPVKCRVLPQPSPFAECWTQTAVGPTEATESPAEALKRLHATLTGGGGGDARPS